MELKLRILQERWVRLEMALLAKSLGILRTGEAQHFASFVLGATVGGTGWPPLLDIRHHGPHAQLWSAMLHLLTCPLLAKLCGTRATTNAVVLALETLGKRKNLSSVLAPRTWHDYPGMAVATVRRGVQMKRYATTLRATKRSVKEMLHLVVVGDVQHLHSGKMWASSAQKHCVQLNLALWLQIRVRHVHAPPWQGDKQSCTKHSDVHL